MKREKKTLRVISGSEDTDASVKSVCWDRVFTALELFLCMTYAVFFSLRFATAWSLKAKYMGAEGGGGGVMWTAGNNRRPASHGLSTILKTRCGNRLSPSRPSADPQVGLLCQAQGSGDAVSGCFLYHVCSPHSEEPLGFHGLFSVGQTHFTIQWRQLYSSWDSNPIGR